MWRRSVCAGIFLLALAGTAASQPCSAACLPATLNPPAPSDVQPANVEREFQEHLTNGKWALDLGNFPQAVKEFELALNLDPTSEVAQKLLELAKQRATHGGNP
jgi:hypothetical protein